MGVMTDWFSASSPDAALAAVADGSWSAHSWVPAHGEPDVLIELDAFTAAVTGVPESDLGLPSPFLGEVEESLVVALPGVLVAALAGLDEGRIPAVAAEIDDAALDLQGEPDAVLRDLAAFCAATVARQEQVFVSVTP